MLERRYKIRDRGNFEIEKNKTSKMDLLLVYYLIFYLCITFTHLTYLTGYLF